MEYTELRNPDIRAWISPYGAALYSLQVRDRDGKWTEVTVNRPETEDPAEKPFAGGVKGRLSGLVQENTVLLEGQELTLSDPKAWGCRRFEVQLQEPDKAVFVLHSPDGDQGLPGALELTVIWQLLEDGIELTIRGTADRTTLLDPAADLVFNLSGRNEPVDHHVLTVDATRFAPVDSEGVPTGELRNVRNTPFDFTEPHYLMEALSSRHPQLRVAGGLNHGFWLRSCAQALLLFCPATGIEMMVDTTLPVAKVSTTTGLEQEPDRFGEPVRLLGGLRIRTGYLDDDIRIDPAHTPVILQPDQVYEETTAFRFRTVPAAEETE